MAIRYEELQGGAAEAFHSYHEQKKRAGQIMNVLAKTCVEELGFPQKNIAFNETAKPGEEQSQRPNAEMVIDRDEQDRWNACMSVRVDINQPGGGYLVTHLFLEVQFNGGEAQLTLAGDSATVAFSDLQGARRAQFAGFVDTITGKIAETNEWFRTGIGKKRPIGFGAAGI